MEKGYSHFVITYGTVRSAKNDLTGKIRKTLHIGNSIPTSYFVSKQEIHWYSVSSSRLIMNFIFSLWNKFGIRECFISTFKANRPYTVGQSCGQNFRTGEQKKALGQETIIAFLAPQLGIYCYHVTSLACVTDKSKFWLSPSAKQRRNPCSGHPPVYQDLSMRHDCHQVERKGQH